MSNVYRLSDYRRQPRVGELNGLLAAYTGGRITRMQFRRMAASRLGYKRHELNHILRDLERKQRQQRRQFYPPDEGVA